MNHDTASFVVQTIRRWWQEVGRVRYPATVLGAQLPLERDQQGAADGRQLISVFAKKDRRMRGDAVPDPGDSQLFSCR
jgi:hypothetical protein